MNTTTLDRPQRRDIHIVPSPDELADPYARRNVAMGYVLNGHFSTLEAAQGHVDSWDRGTKGDPSARIITDALKDDVAFEKIRTAHEARKHAAFVKQGALDDARAVVAKAHEYLATERSKLDYLKAERIEAEESLFATAGRNDVGPGWHGGVGAKLAGLDLVIDAISKKVIPHLVSAVTAAEKQLSGLEAK